MADLPVPTTPCVSCTKPVASTALLCRGCGACQRPPPDAEAERAVLNEWHGLLVWAQTEPRPGATSNEAILRNGLLPTDSSLLIEEVEFLLAQFASAGMSLPEGRLTALMTRLELLAASDLSLRRKLEVLKSAVDVRRRAEHSTNRAIWLTLLALIGAVGALLWVVAARCS